MKIEAEQSYLYKSNKYTPPSFRGINLISKTHYSRVNRFQGTVQDYAAYMSSLIGQPASVVEELIEHANKEQLVFFKNMATRYFSRNRNLEGGLKDNSDYILNIFNMVEKPLPAHSNIVQKTNASFKYLEDIFKMAPDEKSLMAVQSLQHDILSGSTDSAKIIIDILKSKNKDIYLENLADYASYLKLNSNSSDSVKKLDELVSSGKYNRMQYDAELRMKNERKDVRVNSVIESNPDLVRNNYTEERLNFLDKICTEFMYYNKISDKQNYADVLNMYKTVTPENYAIRRDILETFKRESARKIGNPSVQNEIKEMRELFEKIDAYPEVKKFVEKALAKDLKVDSIAELNEIINTVPLKKADIFFSNLKRIVSLSSGEERHNALINDLSNPFYNPETSSKTRRSYSQDESSLSKIMRYLENLINTYLYNKAVKAQKPYTVLPLKHKVAFTIPKNTADIPAALKLVRTGDKDPSPRKLRVMADVNNIIKEKLGEKTLEKQQLYYTKNATKIRLSLLPDIFDSIKDSKKTGKTSISNRDAIRLYSRITGRNRKLVRYMLLKRNTDNTRLFNVRDIIHFIDNADSKIAKDKDLYGSSYRAVDAKAYYETLYSQMIEKYGKLPRSK